MSYTGPFALTVPQGGTGGATLAAHGLLVGEGTGAITALSVGTDGQVLLGDTTSDPNWVTPTAGSGLSITTNDTTLSYAISAPVSIANGGTNATSMATTDGVVYFDGTRLVTTAVGTSTYVLTSNGTGVAPTFQAAVGGVSSVTGTTNEITASPTTGAVILTIPSTLIAPGSIEATTTITADAGNITATAGSVVVGATSANSSAKDVDFKKSRTGGVITSGDTLGTITWQGHDGTGYIVGSEIISVNSGTVATNRIASDLEFYTHPDSTTASTQRVVINSAGNVTINNPDSGAALTLSDMSASGLVVNSSAGVLTTAATTNHAVQIGNSSGQLTSLSVGTDGQILLGDTTSDPNWVTPTAGSGLSITTNDTTLSYAISAPVSIANGGTNATSMATTDGVVYYDGTRLVTTAVGTSGQVLTSNGTGVAPTFQTGSGGGGISTLNGDSGSATGSTVTIAGTSNEITTSATSATVTLSIPSTFVAPGSIEATTTVKADSGDITATNGNVNVGNTAASTASPFLNLKKSRSAGVITSGDLLGTVVFEGIGTGSTYVAGASITSTSSGTIASNRVAGNLVFATHPDSTSGGTSATTRMTIDTTGAVTIATPDSGVGLTISGGGETITAGDFTISAGQCALTTPVSSSTGMITYDGNPFIWQYPSTHSSAFFAGAGNIGFVVGSGNNYNLGIGYQALHTMGGGEANIGIGYQALYTGSNTGGNFQYNVAMGFTALNSITTGSNNIGIGYQAGTNYTGTESSNIIIGNTGTVSESNVLRIGTQGSGTLQQNTCYIAGITGVTVTGTAVLCSTSGLLGTVVSSARFKENIKDMSSASDKVMSLRPVTFNFIDGKGPFGENSDSKSTQYGLIAEEVAEIMPDLVVFDEGLPHSVKYHDLPAMLLNEMQKMMKRIEYLEDQLKGWEEK